VGRNSLGGLEWGGGKWKSRSTTGWVWEKQSGGVKSEGRWPAASKVTPLRNPSGRWKGGGSGGGEKGFNGV